MKKTNKSINLNEEMGIAYKNMGAQMALKQMDSFMDSIDMQFIDTSDLRELVKYQIYRLSKFYSGKRK